MSSVTGSGRMNREGIKGSQAARQLITVPTCWNTKNGAREMGRGSQVEDMGLGEPGNSGGLARYR